MLRAICSFRYRQKYKIAFADHIVSHCSHISMRRTVVVAISSMKGVCKLGKFQMRKIYNLNVVVPSGGGSRQPRRFSSENDFGKNMLRVYCHSTRFFYQLKIAFNITFSGRNEWPTAINNCEKRKVIWTDFFSTFVCFGGLRPEWKAVGRYSNYASDSPHGSWILKKIVTSPLHKIGKKQSINRADSNNISWANKWYIFYVSPFGIL